MPEANNPDTELYWLIGILAAFFLFLVIGRFAMFINDFSQELRYLNNEIGRTTGAERRHWIRQRRRLWLSLIPFVKYWFSYNRACLCGERGIKNVSCLQTFLPRAVPSLSDGRQSKSITILLLMVWLVAYIVVLFDCWRAMKESLCYERFFEEDLE